MFVLILMQSGAVMSVHLRKDKENLKNDLGVAKAVWQDFGSHEGAHITDTMSGLIYRVPEPTR